MVVLVAVIAYVANSGSGHKSHPLSAGHPTTTKPPRSAGSTTTASVPTQLAVSSASWHLSTALSRAVALPTNGSFDVLGGLLASGSTTPSITQYDPATGSAQPVGSLTYPVHDAAGAVIGGHLFVFGGGAATITSASQSFNPGAAGGSSAVAVPGRLPTPRADLSAATGPDGTVYITGGFDGGSFSPSVLSTRDGATFTAVATLSVPVRYAAVVVTGSQMLVIGGETGAHPTTASEVPIDDIQTVNLQTGQVSVVGHLPTPLAHESAAVLGGSVYLFGGRSSSAAVDSVYKLAIAATAVTATLVGHLPSPVSDMAEVTVDQTAYLIGGENSQGLPGTTVFVARLTPA